MKAKTIIIYLSIILGLVFVDQITKYVTFKYFGLASSYTCIPHVVRFDLLYNDGAVLGSLSGQKWLFYIATVIGLGLFSYLLKWGDIKAYPFYTIGLLLMVGGTIGNFIDRVFIGEVRDFITFDFLNNFTRCPFLQSSFNFADMCMTVGVVILIIDIVFGKAGAKWS